MTDDRPLPRIQLLAHPWRCTICRHTVQALRAILWCECGRRTVLCWKCWGVFVEASWGLKHLHRLSIAYLDLDVFDIPIEVPRQPRPPSQEVA